MKKATIRLIKVYDSALVPSYVHGANEDAGMDLHAIEYTDVDAGKWVDVATGLMIELPPGLEAQIRPRSGLAVRHGLTLLNSPGTIDPGYRGEIRVLLINHGSDTYTIKPGDRIAQLVVSPYVQVEWDMGGSLTPSDRGCGGFGSTGT
jgi:dUTP pyrophosphatase